MQETRYRVGSRGWFILCSTALAFLLARCDTRDQPAVPSPRASPGPVRTEDPVFMDVTEASGIGFVHHTGATGEFYLPEIMGAGCALFDYDSDGDLDAYTVQGAALGEQKPARGSPSGTPATNRLFRNELRRAGESPGELYFTDVTEQARVGDDSYGMGCAVGDYDNDGRVDLYVTNFGPNVLFHNNGDGTFTDVSKEAGVDDPGFGASTAFLDYDRDGLLDLFVVNYVHFSTAANRECLRYGGQRTYCGPQSYEAASDRLFHNNGDGTFTDVTTSAGIHLRYGYGLGIVCADFNADGWLDIFVANDATPNQLWINRKNGTFEDAALLAGVAVNADGKNEAGMGVTGGDFDRDGDDDLFLTHERSETNTLYRNLGKGFFEDATSTVGLALPSLRRAGFGTRWFDYDNDGWLDLFVANGAVQKLPDDVDEAWPYRQPDQLYHNVAGGFVETTDRAGFNSPSIHTGRGASFGDVDNDGDLDLLVVNNNGPARLLLNQVGSANRWIRFALEGRRANRDGYGARVALRLRNGSTLWQRLGTDGSYLSASDKRLHFGLGTESEVEFVTVYWPNGTLVERWRGVPVATQTLLREGEGDRVEQQ